MKTNEEKIKEILNTKSQMTDEEVSEVYKYIESLEEMIRDLENEVQKLYRSLSLYDDSYN